ncbi:MAG: hypothetical protein WD294_11270 [Phycisphaeraceae bacterium]
MLDLVRSEVIDPSRSAVVHPQRGAVSWGELLADVEAWRSRLRDWAGRRVVFPDRYVFVGRRTELINVGGHKVSPTQVERVLQEIDGVNDVRVYGKRSSLVGQVVACDIHPRDGMDHGELERTVREVCRSLAAHEQPRQVRMVKRMRISEAGKKVRSR